MAQVSVAPGPSGSVIVNPPTIHCKAGEWLTWTQPPNGQLTVDFQMPPQHPFTANPPYHSTTPGGAIAVQVHHSPTLGSHPYTVALHVDGTTYEPFDPAVIIDDSREFTDDENAELVRAASKKTEELLQEVLDRVTKAGEAEGGTKFFPKGVDHISIDVEVAPVKIALTVSGPKSSGS